MATSSIQTYCIATLAAAAATIWAVACGSARTSSIDRGFDTQSRVFHSDSLPTLNLPIPKPFSYLGRLEFGLGERALVDRHIFAATQSDTIQSLIVLQFEGLIDSAQGNYDFSPPAKEDETAGSNYRFSPAYVELGGHRWVHNTWAFDHESSAKERPDAESARLLRFLGERGLNLAGELIMSRYVTAIGKEKRHELILFYMEPLSTHGHTLLDFPDGGLPKDSYDQLHEHIFARSREIFGKLTD